MRNLRSIIWIACQRRIASASLQIALIVGVILNLINQGGAIWDGQSFSLGQFALNFVVPFCVSSYSAAKNEVKLRHISHHAQHDPPHGHEESTDRP
jgi:hypothetical protein